MSNKQHFEAYLNLEALTQVSNIRMQNEYSIFDQIHKRMRSAVTEHQGEANRHSCRWKTLIKEIATAIHVRGGFEVTHWQFNDEICMNICILARKYVHTHIYISTHTYTSICRVEWKYSSSTRGEGQPHFAFIRDD